VRSIREIADEFLESYKLRNPRSAVFAEGAIRHVKRLLGDRMAVDVNEKSVEEYQNLRLEEKAAPKSINEEIGFLLRLMNDAGDMLRLRLRKKKLLKLRVRRTVGKAYTAEEKARMLQEAKAARSPLIYPALVLALNAGMRDSEIKNLTWGQIDLARKFLVVGESKTDAGEGRTIPLNSALETAMVEYSAWYRGRFGQLRPEWYVFPFGKPRPADPTRRVTTLKTAWNNLRRRAGVTGRWHDSRHTLITELVESAASDQTIMDIAGHVSKQMLKHYSHIRMEAKRAALESILIKQPMQSQQPQHVEAMQNQSPTSAAATHFEGQSLQKSLQWVENQGHRGVRRAANSIKRNGSSGRTRIHLKTSIEGLTEHGRHSKDVEVPGSSR
jgi:integrase